LPPIGRSQCTGSLKDCDFRSMAWDLEFSHQLHAKAFRFRQ
jgi:hypothetical protein